MPPTERKPKNKAIRARVSEGFKKKWRDYVNARSPEETESQMVRAALSDYMQRHPATAIQDRSNPPDVSSETRPESKKKRSNRIE
jgi:hypothetical protein